MWGLNCAFILMLFSFRSLMYSAGFSGSLRGKMRTTNYADGTDAMDRCLAEASHRSVQSTRAHRSEASPRPIASAVNHIRIVLSAGRILFLLFLAELLESGI